MQDASV
ncbi:hypothetical protein CP061683_0454, partial [Chlamydia psittaci 06-1683]